MSEQINVDPRVAEAVSRMQDDLQAYKLSMERMGQNIASLITENSGLRVLCDRLGSKVSSLEKELADAKKVVDGEASGTGTQAE